MLKRSIPHNILFSPQANDGGSGDPSTDEQGVDSSSTETNTEDGESQSLEDVIQEAADSQSEEVEEESGSKVEPDKGEKGKEKVTEPKDELGEDGKPKPKEGQDEDGKPLPPFHAHPRWQEMVTERNTLRDQVKASEADKPLVEQQKSIVAYCTEHNIAPQQFQEALQFVALLNSNPAEARKQLAPIMERLSEFDDSRLPKDLEDEVAEGNLQLERAQEIARLRAQAKGETFRGRISEQQREQQVHQANSQALGSWEQNMFSHDPDFKPKANKDAVDGKYELTVGTFRGLIAVNPPKSPQDVVRLIQQAYDQVNRVFTTRLTPRQATRKQIPSGKSSGTNGSKSPNSLAEAIQQVVDQSEG